MSELSLYNAEQLNVFKANINQKFPKGSKDKSVNRIIVGLFANAMGGGDYGNDCPDDFFYYHMRAVEFMFDRHNKGYFQLETRYVLDAAQLFWRNYGEQKTLAALNPDRDKFYKKYINAYDLDDLFDCHQFITMLLLKSFKGFDLNTSKASDGRNLLMITANEDWMTADSIQFLGSLGVDFNLTSEKYGKAVHMLNLMRDIGVVRKFDALTAGGCLVSDEFPFTISHNQQLLESDTAESMSHLIKLYKMAGVHSESLNQINERIQMSINAEEAMKALPSQEIKRKGLSL